MAGVEGVIREFVDGLVASDPVVGTSLGLTDRLDELTSFSPAAMAARVALAQRTGDALLPVVTASDPAVPPGSDAADAAAVLPLVWRLLRIYELRRDQHVRPGFYLEYVNEALLPLMMRDMCAPRERLHALEARLRALPGLLEDARDNLEAGLPRVFVESAAQFVEGLVGLVTTTAPEFAAECERPGSLDDACGIAGDALTGFRDHLLESLLPVSVGVCGAGRAVLEDVLHREHMLDETPEEIAAFGRGLIAETQAEMRELAAAMGFADTAGAVVAARATRPALDDLIPDYRRSVEDARAFVVARDLVTLVDGEELRVVATPLSLRGILPFAAYDPPGPFASRQLGYYYVTPPPPGADCEDALAAHAIASMPTTGVHEGYPGHHVQLTRANRAPTLARRVAGACGGGTLLVEGWAFYCEELMERQGFLGTPEARLMRLNDQVWRACRVVIDAEVAVGRMTFDEAVALLAREARMDSRSADLEVRWYVESPGEPMGYLLGKREVLALAQRFTTRRSASLKSFHDAILDWGSVSPRMIAWGLGVGERPAALAP